MPNHYCTREQLKRAGSISGVDSDAQIDRLIASASRDVDTLTRRHFIPLTATYNYDWPNSRSAGFRLWLWPFDLISVTTLQTKAQDSSPTTISSSDFFLEPNNSAPPFDRIEIDRSSNAVFESGDTPQRSISVAGSWGYSGDTTSAGTVASGLDSGTTTTTFVCSNGSLIDVGDTLLIESEQMFVNERSFNDVAKNLNDSSVTASLANVTITIESSHGILAGEIIRIDSEQMFVEGVNTNDLTVIRQYNGTVLAAHTTGTDVFINRTLSMQRGGNGTTAATHANATAISKYQPTGDINRLCVAETLFAFNQEISGYSGTVGAGDGARAIDERGLALMRKEVKAMYQRVREAAI